MHIYTHTYIHKSIIPIHVYTCFNITILLKVFLCIFIYPYIRANIFLYLYNFYTIVLYVIIYKQAYIHIIIYTYNFLKILDDYLSFRYFYISGLVWDLVVISIL